MTENETFLEAIAANPEDDLVRLIYADWLEEHGQSDRSEFIRTQIELTRIDEHDPRRPGLRAREYSLLDIYRRDWTSELPEWVRAPRFFRGMVEQIEAYAGDWLRDGDEVHRRFPVRNLFLRGARQNIQELTHCPKLQRLETLDLRFNHLGDDGVQVLAESIYLDQLRTLHLWNNHISDLGAVALADARFTRSLRVLSLGGNDITDYGARRLAESQRLPQLEQLVLFDNSIGKFGRDLLRAVFGPRVMLEEEEVELAPNFD